MSHSLDTKKTVYLVGHGWHTGLVVRVADVSRENWPEIQQFSDYRYAEIGWGDEGFYRMDGLKIGTAVNAAFWPSPSVLHVAAFDVEPDLVFEHSDVVAIELKLRVFVEVEAQVEVAATRGLTAQAQARALAATRRNIHVDTPGVDGDGGTAATVG